MSGGAALTLGGGGRNGGGGMFGGSAPGGKKGGILAGVGSASVCSAITCTTTNRMTPANALEGALPVNVNTLVGKKETVLLLCTWILFPSRLCLRRPSTRLMVAVPPPITSIVPLVFLRRDQVKKENQGLQYAVSLTYINFIIPPVKARHSFSIITFIDI